MWFTLFGFVYSPFVLQFLQDTSQNTKLEQRSNASKNFSEFIDPRSCGIDSTNALFYPHSNTELRGCYKTNEKGPCGEFMILYPTEDGDDKTVGQCDCDRKSLRTLLYHEETHRCYPIFQQGYCSPGEWLDLSPEGMPVCQQNPCYRPSTDSRESTEDLVLMNGECVKVGSNSLCRPREMVGFEQTRRLPTCIPKRGVGRSIGAIPIKCRPGTYRAISGRCQPAFEFFFD